MHIRRHCCAITTPKAWTTFQILEHDPVGPHTILPCKTKRHVVAYLTSKQLHAFWLYFAEQNCRAPNNWHCVTYKSYGRWCTIRWELVISGRTRDMRLGDTPPHPIYPLPHSHADPIGQAPASPLSTAVCKTKGGNCLLEE